MADWWQLWSSFSVVSLSPFVLRMGQLKCHCSQEWELLVCLVFILPSSKSTSLSGVRHELSVREKVSSYPAATPVARDVGRNFQIEHASNTCGLQAHFSHNRGGISYSFSKWCSLLKAEHLGQLVELSGRVLKHNTPSRLRRSHRQLAYDKPGNPLGEAAKISVVHQLW